MSYKHLNSDDRSVITTLIGEGRNYTYIANKLGVDKSTISREIKRNKIRSKPRKQILPEVPSILTVDGRKFRGSGFTKTKYEARDEYNGQLHAARLHNSYYVGYAANKKAKAKRALANRQRLKLVPGSGSFVEKYVLKQLTKEQWSPEQIANRLVIDFSIMLSHPTIYKYIYNGGDKKKLVKHLRHHGNKYRRKRGTIARTKNNSNKLPTIHNREAVIETRTRLGDHEGDTVVGLDKKDRLLTHVDRASGECHIGLILSYNANKVARTTIEMVKKASGKIHTITYDRGTEFADYETIQNATGATVYFADAYSSYQRGTNENLNGLIRQYYPKRYDFKQISHKQVRQLEEKLNNRPRKRYNYRTPLEQRAYLITQSVVALRD